MTQDQALEQFKHGSPSVKAQRVVAHIRATEGVLEDRIASALKLHDADPSTAALCTSA